jgi:hypothetical protein
MTKALAGDLLGFRAFRYGGRASEMRVGRGKRERYDPRPALLALLELSSVVEAAGSRAPRKPMGIG